LSFSLSTILYPLRLLFSNDDPNLGSLITYQQSLDYMNYLMNLKKAILPVLLAMNLFSCSKDDIPQPNTIIGNWKIDQIDVVRAIPGMPIFCPDHLRTMPWTGNLIFDTDSSGQFLPAVPFDTDTVSSFTWSHDKRKNWLFFETSNVLTYAIVKYQVADTLELYLRGFKSNIGAIRMYYLKLTK